jgi:hypothetical protein
VSAGARELTREVLAALCAPFPEGAIGFRPGLVVGGQAFALPTVRSGAVERRLDEVVGREGWSFHREVRCAECGRVLGRLTVLGVARAAVGDGEGQDSLPEVAPLDAAAGVALERCALMFGVGRYLRYLLPQRACYDAARGCWTRAPALSPEAVACALAMADTGLLGVQPHLEAECRHPRPGLPTARPVLDPEEARESFLHAAARAGWPLRNGEELERRVNRMLGRPDGDRRAPSAQEWLQVAGQLAARCRR